MKKYARWGLVVLAAVVVIGGCFIIRQVRREKYICSPLDSCVYQGDTLETGTIVGTPLGLRQIEQGTPVDADFISVRIMDSAELDRTSPIELEAGQSYTISFGLPEDSDDFDLRNAIFRVSWSPSTLICAGDGLSLTAVISDGHTTLRDTVSFASHEQALLRCNATGFVMCESYGRPVGLLEQDDVLSLNGDKLCDHIFYGSNIPQYIEYYLDAERYDPQANSLAGPNSNDGAGPMSPIRPSFYGPGEDR